MPKRVFGALAVVAAVAVVPAWAAPPFGYFDGPNGRNAVTGVVGVTGWALDDNGIARVDIYVDGLPVGSAIYGQHRAGVAARYPGYPDSEAGGFGFFLDTTHFLNGVHQVSARAFTNTGESVFLREVALEFTNTAQLLMPFGAIEFPERNAEMRGNCNLSDPSRRYSVVQGFAVDPGIGPTDTGVGFVELLIDGALFANTRTDCFFAPFNGGLTNCYGITRLDIERAFPRLRDAPQSGYRFVLDVGALIDFGYVRGSHEISVRAGDLANQTAIIDRQVVTFVCDEDTPNERSIGIVRVGNNVSGTTPVTGWALDWEGVRQVDIYVDGELAGSATYGLTRKFVAALYPGYPDSDFPGYSFDLDTEVYSDGYHHLQVVVTDALGQDTLIGETTFYVDNLRD